MPSPITVPTVGSDTLTTLAGEATNSTFIGRVAIAIAAIARTVINEDQTYYNVTPANGSGNGQHYARVKLAYLINANPLAYAQQQFAYGALTDFVTDSGSSDGDLMLALASDWNNMATPFL